MKKGRRNTDRAREKLVKRCSCRKATTAKQLGQHGKCVACMLAEAAATLLPDDLEILCPILGVKAHQPLVCRCLRNEYLANGRDLPSMERLIAAGFVRAGETMLQLQYFYATMDGKKPVVQTGKRTAVALGARP